jgi:TRAP-type C4-dicarboxylate transport system permease small subunit
VENNKKNSAAVALMKLNKFVFNIEKIALILIMYGLVAVLFINVVYRFVLFIPSAWADELSRFMFTWCVMLGASAAMYRWEHIDINLVDTLIAKFTKDNTALYEKILEGVKKFAVIASLVYLVYLLVVYGQYLAKIKKLGSMSMFLGCSLLVPMSAIYVCAALMIFHGVCYLVIPKSVREQED